MNKEEMAQRIFIQVAPKIPLERNMTLEQMTDVIDSAAVGALHATDIFFAAAERHATTPTLTVTPEDLALLKEETEIAFKYVEDAASGHNSTARDALGHFWRVRRAVDALILKASTPS